jgi:hypothetical protein
VRASSRDSRIVMELKRCWRRVSAIYSEVQDDDAVFDNLGPAISRRRRRYSENENPSTRNRLPSLILRATRKREETLFGLGPSRSQPDMRMRFAETGRSGNANATGRALTKAPVRIHSTSSVNNEHRSHVHHHRNFSNESPVFYSKNSSPALFNSFARGDRGNELPSATVKADLFLAAPELNLGSKDHSKNHKTRRLFLSRLKKGTAGRATDLPKASPNLSCLGDISDDEGSGFLWRKNTGPSVRSDKLMQDRVDFLAAGVRPNYIPNSPQESQISIPMAEQLGEALVHGYIQSTGLDDDKVQAFPVPLETANVIDTTVSPSVFDMTMASSESRAYQTTLSMSEIERRLGPTRPPSAPLRESLHLFRQVSVDIRSSQGHYDYTLSPPSPIIALAPRSRRAIRRQPGGDLRQAQTIEELQFRRGTSSLITYSTNSISLELLEESPDIEIPSVSTESRSQRSLLDISHGNRQSHSPTHRTSGLAIDFTCFRMPKDVESSDDENCDPAEAVQKTLLKLEGKYVRKRRRPHIKGDDNQQSLCHPDLSKDVAFLDGESSNRSSGSPPGSIMIERNKETRWGRRHKHVVDGQQCNTPTRHGPFTPSSLFGFIDSTANTEKEWEVEDETTDFRDLYIPLPTVESALAELERDRVGTHGPRIPRRSPPRPPEPHPHSLALHLPFIMQYDTELLVRQFTLIEKDICAEIDWVELVEPTWMQRSAEMVDIRDWKGFVARNEEPGGLYAAVARFNLVGRCKLSANKDGRVDRFRSYSDPITIRAHGRYIEIYSHSGRLSPSS